MIEQGLLCQAERHSRHCDGYADDIDHFSPRCIAKLLSWRVREMDSYMNTQPLNRKCHELKDRDTVKRKQVLQYQLQRTRENPTGGVITWEEHRAIFLGGLSLKDVLQARQHQLPPWMKGRRI